MPRRPRGREVVGSLPASDVSHPAWIGSSTFDGPLRRRDKISRASPGDDPGQLTQIAAAHDLPVIEVQDFGVRERAGIASYAATLNASRRQSNFAPRSS